MNGYYGPYLPSLKQGQQFVTSVEESYLQVDWDLELRKNIDPTLAYLLSSNLKYANIN